MNERNPKLRYDYEFLQDFCKENGVILKKDYSNKKINRETVIEAKCLKCDDICSKTFRLFISIGCLCKIHTAENRIEKFKESCITKYGCEYPTQNKEVREKIIQKCILNYGVENVSQCETIKDKKVETCLKNWGTKYSLQNKELQEKVKATNLEKYGCEYPTQNKEVRTKTVNTCLKKYGAMCPAQNAEIAEKQSKNAYKSKDYIFPSGRIERIQGYEHFMLYHLLQKENILEDDIIVSRKEVPKCWYEDTTGKIRRYFVDCFIKSQNRCIEVKSTWSAKKAKDANCIYLKQQALKNAGYLCEIWIYDGKGELVEKIV